MAIKALKPAQPVVPDTAAKLAAQEIRPTTREAEINERMQKYLPKGFRPQRGG